MCKIRGRGTLSVKEQNTVRYDPYRIGTGMTKELGILIITIIKAIARDEDRVLILLIGGLVTFDSSSQ